MNKKRYFLKLLKEKRSREDTQDPTHIIVGAKFVKSFART